MTRRTLRRSALSAVIAGLLAASGTGLDAGLPSQAPAAPGVVPRFARDPNPIALRGPARPERYMEASGRKAALLGCEDGSFEAWVYPLKVLHDFRLSFGTPDYAEPIPGVNLAATVDVRPEASAVRFAHAAFTVDAVWLVPLDDQGAIVLLDVTTSQPLQVVVKFRPDLKPMWPAALGGQYSYWDAGQKAYVLGEASGKHSAMIGSPFGIIRPSSRPQSARRAVAVHHRDHARDRRARFRADCHLGEPRGARGREGDLPETARVERGDVPRVSGALPPAARGDDEHRQPGRPPRSRVRVGEGRARQGICLQSPPRVRAHRGPGAVGHERTAGFGWFFGGDAFINSWAMTVYGDFDTVKRTLEFLRARQRADGKMMHELSQGGGVLQVVRGVSVRLLPCRHDAPLHHRGARLRAGERRRQHAGRTSGRR